MTFISNTKIFHWVKKNHKKNAIPFYFCKAKQSEEKSLLSLLVSRNLGAKFAVFRMKTFMLRKKFAWFCCSPTKICSACCAISVPFLANNLYEKLYKCHKNFATIKFVTFCVRFSNEKFCFWNKLLAINSRIVRFFIAYVHTRQ